ncbi:MAG: adenylosuccinate synthase [Anaerolineae bacterium]|jgi:adenylosuccinate synthase|nr:adenylosuccinate synthase [Anaerolineae bacterium]
MKLKGTNIVIDTAWGDSGKGKFVDVFSGDADLIVRFNGGANAGHTVVNDYGEFKFHLIPTGIFNPNALSILAGSVAISPLTLVEEINELREKGVSISPKNLLISEYAHMIMPWHIARDSLRETARGDAKVGTTGRGIGPLYADRTERVGVRMGDMLKENFEKIILRELDWQTKLIALMDTEEPSTYLESLAPEKVLADFRAVQEILAPMIGNPLPLIWEAQKAGKEILGEGAQGILLDIDLGTYPFVTSSHPGVTGFSIATGLQQNDIARVIGVTKAYQTRVGEGPMPTELLGEVGDKLRELGNEYGATTGRPRRCGWLDLPSLRYSLQVGGVNSIALTKIDVLDGMDEIKICTHYEHNGKKYDTLPTADAVFMAEAKAIYKTMPKWDGATFGVKDFSDFPQEAQDYVQYIEDAVGVSVEIISNGPAREEVFYRV